MRFFFLPRLALASAWNRRLTLGLTLIAIALAACLLLAIERTRHHARDHFMQSVSGADLIVGARGSSLQLVLHALFRLGESPGDIRWTSYRQVAAQPGIAWTIPLSLGDSHRGYPVLGTTQDYFAHFRHGLGEPLQLAAGRPFAGVFEAVLGAEVAARLGYGLDSQIVLSHGATLPGQAGGPEHADKPFTVVGILAPTGTPVDRTVHVDLAAIEAIHLDWQGGLPIPGLSIPAAAVRKFDLTPKQISAFLVGLDQRTQVFRVQRAIQAYQPEALQAVLPGIALDQLWQNVAKVENLLRGIAWLVLAVSLSGLVAVMLAGLGERRRELAILRSTGAGPRHIVLLLLCESLSLGFAGAAAGWGLTALLGHAVLPWLSAQYGLSLPLLQASPHEAPLFLTIVGVCALAGLLPAWRASRLALADGLTPRL